MLTCEGYEVCASKQPLEKKQRVFARQIGRVFSLGRVTGRKLHNLHLGDTERRSPVIPVAPSVISIVIEGGGR
jgi:hypothetical protein